ncbi:MAG: hypothetical protein HXY34_01450 [Candidatus Thorarchaeota archaeon]|nr:hypothetical protein [Candidatus Thorarchaeota archaeon]
MQFKSRTNNNGLEVEFRGRWYPIVYEKDVWMSTPERTRVAIKDNLALAVTMHLPLVFGESEAVYHSGRPVLEPYFFMNFMRDIPSCTEVDGLDTAETTRKWFNTYYRFMDPVVVYPSSEPVRDPHRAIVGLSFGKDSLLTFAVADELGLDPEIVYVVEHSLTYEEKHKTALAERFKKEFGKSLWKLEHETGLLRDYPHLGLPFSEFGWGLQTTEYALELIPFAYALGGKYLLFGNEHTTAETYMSADKSGPWLVNPCYDQTHEWTVHIDQITQMFSGRSVRTGSLIEPLMDMMIQRTLARRYPKYAKYQMSCFTETEAGKDYHWCHNCSICAKMYLLCAGSGVDPQVIGLRQNMLNREHRRLFTLFGGRSALTYANTPTAKDEQLFGFYCAALKGAKGELVEDFKSSELFQEAKEREDELFKKFVTVYEPISVPAELKAQVMSIYREELASFEL